MVDLKYAEKTWKNLEHAIHESYNYNAGTLSFKKFIGFFSFYLFRLFIGHRGDERLRVARAAESLGLTTGTN